MADPQTGYLLVETEDQTVSGLVRRLTFPNGALLLSEADSAEVNDTELTSLQSDTRTRFRAASDLPVIFRKAISTATAADPSTLGDLLNWYKADTLSLSHGDSVTSWGNSGSGSAATPGSAPTYVTGVVNGKPAVRFTSGNYLVFTAQTTVRTVYAVLKHNYENLTNPIPSLAIGHGTVADWVGNQGTRIFAPSGSVGANITGGAGYYNGTQYTVDLISKSPEFAVYSFVTSGNTSVSRIGSDRETYFFEGDVAEIILCSGAHSTATRQSIESYLISKYDLQMPALLVTDGDSISADQPLFGDGVGDAESAWCIQSELNLESALGSIDVVNAALGGQRWADLIADDTTEIDPLISTVRPRVVVAAMCGTNDLLNSTTLALMQSRAEEYYSGRQTAGALVVAVTVPSCDTNEATRLSYNQWLRDNYTDFADALADPGLDPRMVDTTNTAYFETDEIHLTAAGLGVLAEHIAPAVLLALNVSEPAEIEFTDPNSYEPSIWIKTSTFIGYADNDAVATPPNRSITGNVVVTQGTAANRALYKVNLQNSKPGLRFDGSNDSYTVDSAEYRTIFIVAKYAPGTTFADFNGLLDLSGNRHLLNGVSGTSKLASGTLGMLAAYKNGVEKAFSSGYDFAPINTYWIGSFILPTKQTGTGILGIVTGGAGRIWNGDILELIVYPQRLNDAQRKHVEGYLGYEYAISTGSSYSPAAQDGKIRWFSGPTGLHILDDGNEIITVSTTGAVTFATALSAPSLNLIPGAWQSWTPTWTNVTPGTGATVVAKYMQIGKLVIARLSLVFGTSMAVSGDIQFSLPVTRAAYGAGAGLTTLGAARAQDTSVPTIYPGDVINTSTTVSSIRFRDTSGTYETQVITSSTIPFAWASTDEIAVQMIYEAA